MRDCCSADKSLEIPLFGPSTRRQLSSRCILPLCSPISHVILDLNDALLPNGERDGLLGRNLLQKVQGAWPLEDMFQLLRGGFQYDRILRCSTSYDSKHFLEGGRLRWWRRHDGYLITRGSPDAP